MGKWGPQKSVLVSFYLFICFKMEKTCRCLYSKEKRIASTGKPPVIRSTIYCKTFHSGFGQHIKKELWVRSDT